MACTALRAAGHRHPTPASSPHSPTRPSRCLFLSLVGHQVAPVVSANSSQSRADVAVIVVSAVLVLTGLQVCAGAGVGAALLLLKLRRMPAQHARLVLLHPTTRPPAGAAPGRPVMTRLVLTLPPARAPQWLTLKPKDPLQVELEGEPVSYRTPSLPRALLAELQWCAAAAAGAVGWLAERQRQLPMLASRVRAVQPAARACRPPTGGVRRAPPAGCGTRCAPPRAPAR